MKYLSILALILTLLSCGDEVVTFKTDKERYSYLLGVEIAKPFITQAPFTKMDKEKMIEGFENPVKEAELKKYYRDLELLLGQTGKSFNEKYKEQGSFAVGKINRERFDHYFDELDAKELINSDFVKKGFSDGLNKKDAVALKGLDRKKIMASFEALMNEKYQKITAGYKAEGEAFMAANQKKPGVITTASGLQYIVLKEGKGPKPGRDARVKMSYIGMNPDGSIFDQSPLGEGISFGLNEVIPGWTEGIQLMSVGTKIRLFVPQELGYAGNPPQGANIKPYSPLIFEMELMAIEKAAAPNTALQMPDPRIQ
ncbi:MAG: FKBP-type peptidyl-prolyl cis-trans isomerase N-terminal domain-containing protein [Flavobacteriia bacterium]|jgi:FKBP-type peptidyl-prolyl cis-trans isomerase|nr:FKBP-type peptidyl-prolyl cis-trans isomerase [Cryomorphaceae bacterium]